jgi:hypothetical protein
VSVERSAAEAATEPGVAIAPSVRGDAALELLRPTCDELVAVDNKQHDVVADDSEGGESSGSTRGGRSRTACIMSYILSHLERYLCSLPARPGDDRLVLVSRPERSCFQRPQDTQRLPSQVLAMPGSEVARERTAPMRETLPGARSSCRR